MLGQLQNTILSPSRRQSDAVGRNLLDLPRRPYLVVTLVPLHQIGVDDGWSPSPASVVTLALVSPAPPFRRSRWPVLSKTKGLGSALFVEIAHDGALRLGHVCERAAAKLSVRTVASVTLSCARGRVLDLSYWIVARRAIAARSPDQDPNLVTLLCCVLSPCSRNEQSLRLTGIGAELLSVHHDTPCPWNTIIKVS
jgi:hypothetical protein